MEKQEKKITRLENQVNLLRINNDRYELESQNLDSKIKALEKELQCFD